MPLSVEDRICICCVASSEAQLYILNNGDLHDCSVHGHTGDKTISLRHLAEFFGDRFPSFYGPGSYKREFDGPNDDNGHDVQQGQSAREVLEDDLACDDPEIAETITRYLHERDRPSRPGDPDDVLLWHDDQVFEADASAGSHAHSWQWFVERISHERRFFDPEAMGVLDELFGDDVRASWSTTEDPVRKIEPGKVKIFRARLARDRSEAKRFLGDPVLHLRPPPAPIASAGRLNPHGIRRFYGGLAKETCVAELRPAVGDLVVIGEFELLEPILVYDFSVFERDFFVPNMFDESVSRNDFVLRNFLYELHDDLTRPIASNDEPLDYIPTQMIAEYLEQEIRLDGIVTKSAQTNDESLNITLFGANGLIEGDELGLNEGDSGDQDGTDIDFTPAVSFESKVKKHEHMPTLRLFDSSVQCVRITASKYESENFYMTL